MRRAKYKTIGVCGWVGGEGGLGPGGNPDITAFRKGVCLLLLKGSLLQSSKKELDMSL